MEKLLKTLKLLIFVLGFVVRFYQLGGVPASFNRDEPAIGYNAYSILKTGRDEWGRKFPLTFKSFGDYKSSLYIYLTVIPIALFGLTEFSVRFWAALAGGLTVIVIYFLVKELLGDQKMFGVGELTAFLLAISSWHIFFSRFSFEANLALLFNALILYLWVKNNFKRITFSMILLFLLTFLTYSSSLVIWPIFIFIWTLSLLKNIFLKKENFSFKPIIPLLILFIILGFILKSQASISQQKKRVTVLGDPQIALNLYAKRTEIAAQSPLKAKLFYNQYFTYGGIILINYLKSFSPFFLFAGGGQHPWHKIPQVPHFYPLLSFLSFLGLIFFIKIKKIKKENKFFLSLFFLLSPLASALTVDAPHATRLLNLFLFLILLAGFGLFWLFKKLRGGAILLSLILVFNFGQFCKFYFVDYKQNPPIELLPGLKEAISLLKKEKDKAERIVFDNRDDGAYAYLLFYEAYPPGKFMQKTKRYSGYPVGLEWVERFDKYVFTEGPIPDQKLKEIYVLKGGNSLVEREIVTVENEFSHKIYYRLEANF
jgi:hypothetical protein